MWTDAAGRTVTWGRIGLSALLGAIGALMVGLPAVYAASYYAPAIVAWAQRVFG